MTLRAGKRGWGQSRGQTALRPAPYPCGGAGRGRELDISSVPLNNPRSARQLHSSFPSGEERSKFSAWSGFQMCGSTWDAESQQSPRIRRALGAPDNSSQHIPGDRQSCSILWSILGHLLVEFTHHQAGTTCTSAPYLLQTQSVI